MTISSPGQQREDRMGRVLQGAAWQRLTQRLLEARIVLEERKLSNHSARRDNSERERKAKPGSPGQQ
jgi:uracil-DNA glycosylase